MPEVEKNEESKIRGGGGVVCAPRAQHGRGPKYFLNLSENV